MGKANFNQRLRWFSVPLLPEPQKDEFKAKNPLAALTNTGGYEYNGNKCADLSHL